MKKRPADRPKLEPEKESRTKKKKESRTAKTKPSADSRAEHFRSTRAEHAAEVAEDYVEAIADLVAEHGEARAVDLAARLGVTHVTVVRTIARLQRDGLVSSRPYRAIFLTEDGSSMAQKSRDRHQTVIAFLEALGVPKDIAERDAEGIEHHVSPETLTIFRKFIASKKRK